MKKITRKEFIRLLETSAIAVGSILITGCANSSKSPSSGTHLFGDSVNFNGIQIIFSLWNQKDVPNTPAYSNYQNQKIIQKTPHGLLALLVMNINPLLIKVWRMHFP